MAEHLEDNAAEVSAEGAYLADLGIEIPAAAAPVAFTTAASIHSCPEILSDLARLSGFTVK